MIWDTRIMAYLFAQICMCILLAYGAWRSIEMLRYWNFGSGTEFQNRLESQQDLLKGVLQLSLWMQVLLGAYFLMIINNIVPHLIKGAMCASGVLNSAAGGEFVIITKIVAIPLFFWFASLERVEDLRGSYLLTPKKYVLVVIIFALSVFDFAVGFNFLASLKPDIITSCCSVDTALQSYNQSGTQGEFGWAASMAWLAIPVLVFSSSPFFILVSAVFFIGGNFFALKWGFVKYIYGNPIHDCLYDLCLKQHNFLGYWLAAAYLLFCYQVVQLMVKKAFDLKTNRFFLISIALFINILPLFFYVVSKASF